jgi:pimeloyl-ACP methyl ester carboxylesterase
VWTPDLIPLPDGRQLEVLWTGDPDALPVVLHGGTPGGPVPYPEAAQAAAEIGLRVLMTGRPGYGRSTPQPGRSVADVAADTAAVLDHYGLVEFVTSGASGGGPHSLACAALLPGRCLAASTVAGVAPYDADGLDFLAGMGEENVEEFGLALQGREALEPFVAEQVGQMGQATPEAIVEAMGSLLPPVDLAVVTGELSEMMVAGMTKAFEVSGDGWIDDDLAFTKPWGFGLDDIAVPVTVWQGALDMMVPFAHGQWLAAHVPGATARLYDEHGHLSLAVAHLPEVLRDLVSSARR